MPTDFHLPLATAAKIGSALVHADEALNSRTPAAVDVAAFLAALNDADVQAFLDNLRARALVPVKR